jgi:DNA-binding MarR family transcriptional regulator
MGKIPTDAPTADSGAIPMAHVERVAAALHASVGLVVRRMRRPHTGDGLSIPETSALVRLATSGPQTISDLARREEISPQSMGATISSLDSHGMITRSADPHDGRRVLLTPSAEGLKALEMRHNARASQFVQALLTGGFTASELDRLLEVAPLLDRIAAHMPAKAS